MLLKVAGGIFVWFNCVNLFFFCLLCRLLSALAHWAAIFSEVEYIPLLSFPFVKLFQNNPMLCFEVVATVIGTSLLRRCFKD